ncbi:carbonic anhydrase [Rubritalea marina]|uniref:carbonic anhydrase n=1 Tax=Rubritalea marina TaxID=361055 RepID=UPI0014614C13|nr:carbonic anhydrase [Rubritalea marina]
MSATAKDILDELVRGNAAYASGEVVAYDRERDQTHSASPQFPKAVVVSCLDSRVPVERVFNQGVGDLFVARVAGNVMNDDIVGSLEFALIANEVKLVIVLGHTKCGAVKGACAHVELGSLTQLLDKIQPAIEQAKADASEGTDFDSAAFIDAVAAQNAVHVVEEIKKSSPGIADLAKKGEVLLVPAIYDLESQRVELLS